MLRLFISILLLFSLGGCASVDQALYDVSTSVSSVDRITGTRSLNFADRQAQIAKSNSQIEQLISTANSENIQLNEAIDQEAYKRLVKIFERVHQVSHFRDEEWNILMIPDEEFNAFVNGGTYVVVNYGLMKQAENDDEIAAVIGHEIAHVAGNHVYERNSHLLVASLKGSKSASRDTFQAAYTHKNEEEADKVGILYATLAGYDPYAAAKLWKRMRDNEGDYSRAVNSHPINGERAKKAEELAGIYEVYYQPGTINSDYALALDSNPVFGRPPEDMSASLAPGQGGGFLALLEVTLDGVAKHYEAKAEEERQKLQAQRVSFTEQDIKWIDFTPIDSKAIRIKAQHSGYNQLKDLTIVGIVDNEKAVKIIEKYISPGEIFEFDLEFKNPDISKLKIGITHVEWI